MTRQRGFAAVAPRLLDQAGLVEELIAVEHFLFVPRAAAGAKAKPNALAPAQRARGLGFVGAHSPLVEQRQGDLVEDVRALLAPVLPRKEAVPGLEAGAGGM